MEKLAKQFVKLALAFGSEMGALYCAVEKEKKKQVVSLYFRVVKLQLVYSCKWVDIAPPSVLYCRVFPDKNRPVFLQLPEILHYLGANDFRACYFPYIETRDRMDRCVRALADILRTHLPAMEKLSASDKEEQLLQDWLKRELGEEDLPKKVDLSFISETTAMTEFAWVATFTIMDAYQAFLRGDLEKAKRLYRKRRKKDPLSPYEEDLLRFLDAGGTVEPMPPGCYAAEDYRRFSGQMQDWKGVLLLYPPFAALFCVLLAVVDAVLSRGTLFFSSVPWWVGLLLGLMPPLFCYPLLQKKIMALRFRKEWKQALAFLEITSSPKWVKWMSGSFLVVVLVFELWFCFAVPPMAMRMYEGHGIYYSEEEKLERFSYDQVTAVYYISARYNVYGDRVERDSYVLLLSDGTTIDLDCEFGDVQGQYQVVSTLFPEYRILELDSDRDLP